MAPGSKPKSCASVQVFQIQLPALRTGSTDQNPSLSSTYSQLLKWSISFVFPLSLTCLSELWACTPPHPVFSFFPTNSSFSKIHFLGSPPGHSPAYLGQSVCTVTTVLTQSFVVFISSLPSKMGELLVIPSDGTTAEWLLAKEFPSVLTAHFKPHKDSVWVIPVLPLAGEGRECM